jgi:hypothetical protein
LLGFVLQTVGSGVLKKAFKNFVKAIEARNVSASVAAWREYCKESDF